MGYVTFLLQPKERGMRLPLTMFFRSIKLILLAIYLAFDHQAIFERLTTFEQPFSLLLYLGLYGLLVLALLAAAFAPAAAPRLALAALLAVASTALQSYQWATGSPLDFPSFKMMVSSAADASDAMYQNGDTFAKAVGAALVLFLALALPPKDFKLPFKMHWLLPAGSILGLSIMLYARGGEGTRALPAPIIPLSYAAIMGVEQLAEESGPRKAVAFQPARSNLDRDIILIVDESIAPKYLDIENPEGVFSGLAVDRPDLRIFNYGVAASITNCSVGSNLTLRFGGTRGNFQRMANSYPSIWAYAHKAGLRTVYLDGQRNNGRLQDGMTRPERDEIDDFVQLDGVSAIQRDHMLARLIAGRIANGQPELILVNKVGAHFPVADKYPVSATLFRPTPQRSANLAVTVMDPLRGKQKGTPEEWRLYRNAYRNTLAWNVGGFFEILLPKVDPAKAIIIYTSDHGQDLHERNNPGRTTHCVRSPFPEEGAVPLVVIDSPVSPRLDWQTNFEANRNATSHYRIFPTLLALMGYATDDILPLYGPTLASSVRDPMTFTSNYFATLGRKPTWVQLDPKKLSMPPRSDSPFLQNEPVLASASAELRTQN